MLGDMCQPHLLERLGRQTRQPRGDGGIRIPARVVEPFEARCRVDDDDRLLGPADPYRGALGHDAAASGPDLCADSEGQPPFYPLGRAIASVPSYAIVRRRIAHTRL